MDKNSIKITSKISSEFNTDIVIKGKKYHIQTEAGGAKKPFIITRIFIGGELISTKKTDYKDILKAPDMKKRLEELMYRQHRMAVSMHKYEKSKESKTPSDYIDEAETLLRRKNSKSALKLLEDALVEHPGDPFLLSYCGCLEAIVDKKYKEGIGKCLSALDALKGKLPFGEEFFIPVFHLNLGRACLAAGRKKEAVSAFKAGLSVDKGNPDLLWEMKKIGMRKPPPIPFLERANPINKYIGMLIHRLSK
jgi:tetratricopeptide (TPR) repeat protein